MKDMRAVSVRLRALRGKAKLSQRELAELSGVGVKTISYLETGSRAVSTKLIHIAAILNVYDLTLTRFFGDWSDGMPEIVIDRERKQANG
jgi:transcriptional regulator with XRE-family HTH domain